MESDTNPKELPRVDTLKLLRLIELTTSTKSSERTLLVCLALHADMNKRYVCWPSYDTLAKWTQLHPTTLRLAAAGLEDKELIRRVERPYTTNLFFINVERILAEVAEIRKVEGDKLAEEIDQIADGSAGSPQAAPTDEELQDDDEIEGDEPVASLERLLDGIVDTWGSHPNFKKYPNYRNLLKKDLKKCVKLAGDIYIVDHTIYHIAMQNEKNRKWVADSKSLGSAIAGGFPSWLQQYKAMQGQEA